MLPGGGHACSGSDQVPVQGDLQLKLMVARLRRRHGRRLLACRLREQSRSWGLLPGDADRALPGDDLVARADVVETRSLDHRGVRRARSGPGSYRWATAVAAGTATRSSIGPGAPRRRSGAAARTPSSTSSRDSRPRATSCPPIPAAASWPGWSSPTGPWCCTSTTPWCVSRSRSWLAEPTVEAGRVRRRQGHAALPVSWAFVLEAESGGPLAAGRALPAAART